MKISKAILVCGAAFLASCGDYKLPFPSKGNPVDDQKIIFLGQEIDPGRDGGIDDQVRKLISATDGGRGINDGFTGLILRSFARGGFDAQTDFAKFSAQPSDKRCAQAKLDKIAFHTAGGDPLPLTFGKIIDMDIHQFSDPYWAGDIDLCTWIKSGDTYDEYLFHLDFNGDLGPTNTLQSHAKSGGPGIPFPGTLTPDPAVDTAGIIAMMDAWDYKIHAKRNGVEISTVWRNGALLPKSDPAYKNDQECFDMFLSAAGHAELVATGELPEQNGYCMGRCDALILNTR